jgi:plastocyanin
MSRCVTAVRVGVKRGQAEEEVRMRKGRISSAALAVGLASALLAVNVAEAHRTTPRAASKAQAIMVKSLGREGFVRAGSLFKGATSNLRWGPLLVSVASGQSITFEHGDKTMDPHTVTIATSLAQLPKSFDQAEPPKCKPCAVAQKHGGENGPPKHWILNAGKPGFDTLGDSVALAPKGPHKSATVVISAPAGTTLYFVCAIHPWMQGEIKVTS